MKKIFPLCALLFILIQNASAKIWWGNNKTGVQDKIFTATDDSKQINMKDLSSGVHYLVYQSGNSVVSMPFDKE